MEFLLLQFPRVGRQHGSAIPADGRARPVLDVHNVITSARETLGTGGGTATQPGDASEIASAPFGIPPRNPLAVAAAADIAVQGL